MCLYRCWGHDQLCLDWFRNHKKTNWAHSSALLTRLEIDCVMRRKHGQDAASRWPVVLSFSDNSECAIAS